MKLIVKDTFEVTPEVFFESIFFDREFNERLYRDELQMPAFELEVLETEGERRRKRVRVTPKQDAPAVVRKIVSGELSYVEDGTWDRRDGVYRYTIATSVAADRIRIGGRVLAVPVGTGRCERTVELEVEVKVPLVGGQLERFLGERLQSSFEQGARFTARWISDKGL